jgi:hypothetical protein
MIAHFSQGDEEHENSTSGGTVWKTNETQFTFYPLLWGDL